MRAVGDHLPTDVIAVIFEVEMRAGRAPEYFELAAALREELDTIAGFISVERFESLTTPGKYLSLSVWRDADAVARWKAHARHREAQIRGKESIFTRYRIRVAEVIRDYGSS